MRIVPIAIIGSVIALGALPAAGYDPRAVVQHIFDTADTDRSGALTRTEYAEAGLERFGVSFDDCDENGDGETTFLEYLKVYLRHHPSGEET